MYGLNVVATDLKVEYFVAVDAALLNECATCYDHEELPLGVVPMLSLGDAGLGYVDAYLPVVACAQ